MDLKDVTDGIHIYMLMSNHLQHVSLQLNFKDKFKNSSSLNQELLLQRVQEQFKYINVKLDKF